MGARETALNALIACRKSGAWSNGVLKEYIVRDRLDKRDAALASRLCYGVLQNRGKLDFYLKQLLTGKIHRQIQIRYIFPSQFCATKLQANVTSHTSENAQFMTVLSM